MARMRSSVAAAWPAMASRFEGRCFWMYQDVKHLVTTGIGFLIDSVSAAQALTWIRISDGLPASPDEVEAEWRRVKALDSLADNGGFAYKPSARLRLPEPEIDRRLMEITERFWDSFKTVHPDVDLWPADAQLAALDLIFQNGPKFTRASGNWPSMRAAFHAENWAEAAMAVPGTHPRARVRERLFRNAAKVAEFGLDRDKLWDMEIPVKPELPPTPPPVEPPPPTGDPVLDVIRSLPVKHSKTPPADYVTYQGEHILPLDLEIVLRCAAAVGWGPVHFIQGGLSKGILSASTHTHFGGYDIRTRDHSLKQCFELVGYLHRSGIVGFLRGVGGGDSFDPHAHLASREAGKLAHESLRRQIAEFLDGGDGLVGSRDYFGPSVRLATWAQSPLNPANITVDTGMYRVTTDGDRLLGVDVDRRIKTRVDNGTVITASRRVERWGRPNIVVDDGSVGGLWFSAQYLTPVEAVPEPEDVVVNP